MFPPSVLTTLLTSPTGSCTRPVLVLMISPAGKTGLTSGTRGESAYSHSSSCFLFQNTKYSATSGPGRVLRGSVHAAGRGAAGRLRLLSLRRLLQGVPPRGGVRALPRPGLPPRHPRAGGAQPPGGRAAAPGPYQQDRVGETPDLQRSLSEGSSPIHSRGPVVIQVIQEKSPIQYIMYKAIRVLKRSDSDSLCPELRSCQCQNPAEFVTNQCPCTVPALNCIKTQTYV